MRESRLKEGQKVRYRAKTAAGIDMKVTTVVGFQDIHENLWKNQYSDVAQGFHPCKVEPGQGRMENRYVIEHYFGWYPSLQSNINPDLELNINRRYSFAYESELSILKDKHAQKMES